MWTILFKKSADKELRKLPINAQKQIRDYLNKKILNSDDPTVFAKPMSGQFAGLWRFRIEKYRLIFEINKDTITIIVFKVGKRDKIYD